MKHGFAKITGSLLALLLITGPLWAEGLRAAQVLAGWRMASGEHIAAVELDLADGWKTYWRTPGPTGFPPQFDWQGSQNVASVEILWPAPHAYVADGLNTIGYSGRVVLPIRITPKRAGEAIRLNSAMELGVCKDICVPVQLDLMQALPATGGQRNGAIIAALADRPRTGAEAGVREVRCHIAPSARGVTLTAEITLPRTGRQEVAVIEPGVQGAYIDQLPTRRTGDVLTATADIEGQALAINRKAIRVTVIGDSGAVEIRGCDGAG